MALLIYPNNHLVHSDRLYGLSSQSNITNTLTAITIFCYHLDSHSHISSHQFTNMENTIEEFNPMRPLDIHDLNFSPQNEERSPIFFQPQPTPVPTQLLSSFQEFASQDLGNNVNNDLPSDFLDPQMLTLDFSHAYEPARTPELAPQFVGELLPSDYHTLRAEWHCNAERFHRHQAQELAELAQVFDNLESHPKQPLPDMDSFNEHSPEVIHVVPNNHVSKSKQENAKKRTNKGHQHHPSRISSSGAVQKLVAPTTALPADLSVALMTDSNLQKHANITDASKIHTRVLQRVMFKPENVYSPLLTRPNAWGHYTSNGQTLSGHYNYNEFGELQPVSVSRRNPQLVFAMSSHQQ